MGLEQKDGGGGRDTNMGLGQREGAERQKHRFGTRIGGDRNIGLGQREGGERQKHGFGTNRRGRETEIWV